MPRDPWRPARRPVHPLPHLRKQIFGFVRICRSGMRRRPHGGVRKFAVLAFLEQLEILVFEKAAARQDIDELFFDGAYLQIASDANQPARRSSCVCSPSKQCRHSTSGGGMIRTASE
jgi:hypothetical protein